jgi:hypothetical protein
MDGGVDFPLIDGFMREIKRVADQRAQNACGRGNAPHAIQLIFHTKPSISA